jgi:Xaa-Pro aminopeptidase
MTAPERGRDAPTILPGLQVLGRIDRLRPRLAEAGADAVLVTARSNIRYLTGFTGSAGVLLVTGNRAVLATDGRYRTQAGEQLDGVGLGDQVDVVVGGLQAQHEAVTAVATREGVSRLGVEAEDISWAGQRRWAQALGGTQVIATAGLVEGLRLVKDAGELARMERAAAIADRALGEVVPMLAEGRTEQEVALALDTAMRRLGAEDRAFETIIAGGPHAAMPHARPTDRPIGRGDPVVMDFGAVFDGYRSDMTRTFCVGGEPQGELARLFSVVAAAQAAGVAAVCPGSESSLVDQACRDLIGDAGWAAAFEHGTGHGVGLDIHEAPSVAPTSTAILTPGVVVTVEPGVYLVGLGGVRIEDTLVVTDDGSRPLTRFPKDVAA